MRHLNRFYINMVVIKLIPQHKLVLAT